MIRLYVLPGACSLASHIALETASGCLHEAGIRWEVVVLDRARNQEPDYTGVNPLGTVPALVTTDGRLIVESLAVLMHIAEACPGARIAPAPGEPGRDRLLMLLSLMATTGHGAFQMLWRPERFADTDEARRAVQRMCELRIATLLERLDGEIGPKGYLVDDQFSVADMYLFVLGRWALRLQRPISLYPRLWQFTQRVAEREAVRRAMGREGIALVHSGSGLG